MLYVSVSTCAGDKDAAERVASRLKDHVANSADRSDASLFWGVRAELIDEEWPHPECLADDVQYSAGIGFEIKYGRWNVQWRAQVEGISKPLKLNIYCTWLNGNKDAAERVASRLKDHVENTADRSDTSLFQGVRAEFVAEELARLEHQGWVAMNGSGFRAQLRRGDKCACGPTRCGISIRLFLHAMTKASLPECRRKCGRRVRTKRSKLCSICYQEQSELRHRRAELIADCRLWGANG